MLRLCRESSRSYPGRPVWQAVSQTAAAAVTQPLIGQESAAVIVGADAGGIAHRLETSRGGIDAEASPHRRTKHKTGKEPQ